MLGSGGTSIGQAGEFDYSGGQAIKVSKREVKKKQKSVFACTMNAQIQIMTSSNLLTCVLFDVGFERRRLRSCPDEPQHCFGTD